MQEGRVVTVASATGGSGKTFLATNLAWFLAHHGQRSVCVIDLDLRFGEVGTALRLRPDRTIADLVGHGLDEADLATRLEECCEHHATGIHVLAAPHEPGASASLTPSDVRALVNAAREHFDDVIIDTPPALDDLVVEAIDQSDEVIVLALMDVPSLRNLRTLLTTLERLQVPHELIRLILNKTDHDAGIEVHELLATFPQELASTLPYAREVEKSTHAGRPVLLTSSASEISNRLGEALRGMLPPDRRAALDLVDLRDRPPRPRRWRRLPLRVG